MRKIFCYNLIKIRRQWFFEFGYVCEFIVVSVIVKEKVKLGIVELAGVWKVIVEEFVFFYDCFWSVDGFCLFSQLVEGCY